MYKWAPNANLSNSTGHRIGAVTFVKRCLMGLEVKHGVPVDAIHRGRWEWMQKYRVWEANRKVFLYPENWIRPELRDDKSPFYKELEAELLQKDVTPENVEESLKNLLYKVDKVANLAVVGLFRQAALHPVTGKPLVEEAETVYSKLHVFARTRSIPYRFYYRWYDYATDEWRPWEHMQVDIPSYNVEETNERGDSTGRLLYHGTYLVP